MAVAPQRNQGRILMEMNDYEREHLNALREANAGCTVLLKRS